MTRLLFIIFSLFLFLNAASIDSKIKSNQNILKSSQKEKAKTNIRIKELAKHLKTQTKQLDRLEVKISKINADIITHQKLLNSSQTKLRNLLKSSSTLKYEKRIQERQIVNTIIRNFSASIALELASKDSLEALIDNEIYNILSVHTKDKILEIDTNYIKLSQDKKINEKNIKNIASYIKQRKRKKKLFENLKKKHSKDLASLDTKHKLYQKALTKVVSQQKSLSSLLSKLNILKDQESKKRKARILAARLEKARLLAAKKRKKSTTRKKSTSQELTQQYTQEVNLDVRLIGSSTRGIKISKYRGKRTGKPLKSFTVIKKFGTYYDPIYKIKLFNESIVLKTRKKRAKVFNVLDGKVVYAKQNAGMLENVVIVKHNNGLHTIYSHLTRISPTLRIGKWIKKGYVVGRVNSTLTFQATKNSYHINPQDLFR